jgi:hypothetical protein
MDRAPAGGAWAADAGAPDSTIEKIGAFLEKLEEASWFTVLHGRAERDAHPNLIEINAFAVRAAFEFGSTSIMETL